jgi:acylglycerol lipase
MHGTADEVTEPEGSKRLHASALSTDKTLTLYPGYVHDLLHEPEHARVEADVVAWLSAR